MRRIKTLGTALVMALVVITCVDYAASAATGGKFILGQLNKANKQTTLKRTTSGPVLGLTTASASNAPLNTNGRGKVTNLNADKLDGLDSSALRTTSYAFTKAVTTPAATVDMQLPLPAGMYIVGYDAYMIGGTLDNSAAGCYFWRDRNGADTYYGENRVPTRTGLHVGLSGSSIIGVNAGDVVTLRCYSPNAWTTDSEEPIHIYATKTQVAQTSALRVATSGARIAR